MKQYENEMQVRLARRDVTREMTTDDDRRPFRCVATLGNVQQICDVVVQVPRQFPQQLFCLHQHLYY